MKYYVRSGQLMYAIAGPHIKTPRDAAHESILCLKNKIFNKDILLSSVTIASVRGFDLFKHEVEEDMSFNTHELLKEIGFTI